jgi:hypothetical protein
MDAEMGSALVREKKQVSACGVFAKTLLLRGRAGRTVEAIMVVGPVRSFYSSLRAGSCPNVTTFPYFFTYGNKKFDLRIAQTKSAAKPRRSHWSQYEAEADQAS